jgi:hypothetical protein
VHRIVTWVLATVLLLTACESSVPRSPSAPSTASGFRVAAFADPPQVSVAPGGAGTGGCARITAEVLDGQGRPVDGVLVSFTASRLTFAGTGDPVVRERPAVNGVATVAACAGSQSGTGLVTVGVENATVTLLIPIV